jgi:hypothetical protein
MPKPSEQLGQVRAPAHGDRRDGDSVFEEQVPADDPGEQLAHRGVDRLRCVSSVASRSRASGFVLSGPGLVTLAMSGGYPGLTPFSRNPSRYRQRDSRKTKE